MISVDEKRVAVFAEFFRNRDDITPFDFCSLDEGVLFPGRSQEGVLEYFFYCTAHQFGFWHLESERYARPMTAAIDGNVYKGSDYVWRCATRRWSQEPGFFHPAHLQTLDDEAWDLLFRDDGGANPLPMWKEHLELSNAYCAWFQETGTTPAQIVASAQHHPKPLQEFLRLAGAVPGYREDALQKKLQLLAVILENRPEGFLQVSDPESYRPIIDYHLQRSALRTGLVHMDDPALRSRLEARTAVRSTEEQAVRQVTFDAVAQLVEMSGRSVAEIDYFFFSNRIRCPEMSEPDCPACPVQSICAKETNLFQPVFRTTAY